MSVNPNTFRQAHKNLDNALNTIDNYKKYLPEIQNILSALTEYIIDLNKEKQEIKDELDDLKKDPNLFSEWKTLLSALGVDAANAVENLSDTFIAYAKNQMQSKITDIASNYKIKLAVDTLKGLTMIGVLPAIIYNYLVKTIQDEIEYLSELTTDIVSLADSVIASYTEFNLYGDNSDIKELLQYAQSNLKKDREINLKILLAMRNYDINALTDTLLSNKDTYFSIAMEAIYPGTMTSDPEYGGEFSNYEYIYRSGISLDALKENFESTHLSHIFQLYIGFLGAIYKNISTLNEDIAEYNKTITSVMAHIASLEGLRTEINKIASNGQGNAVSKLLQKNEAALEDRINYDYSLMSDIDRIQNKSSLEVETFRYKTALDMLTQLKSEKALDVLSDTNLLKTLLTMLSSQAKLGDYKLINIQIKLSLYINLILGMTLGKKELRRLRDTLTGLKKNAIFNEKEIKKMRIDMGKYHTIKANDITLDIGPISDFIQAIGSEDSLAALYAGDIKRVISTISDFSSSIGSGFANMPVSIRNNAALISNIKTQVNAKKDKAIKDMDISTLKTAKMADLSRKQKDIEDKVEQVQSVMEIVKKAINGS